MSPKGITTALLNKTIARAGYQAVEAYPEKPIAYPEYYEVDTYKAGVLIVELPVNKTGWTTKLLYSPENHTYIVLYKGIVVNATEIPVHKVPKGKIKAYAWTRGERKILTYTTNNITIVLHEWDEITERLRLQTEDIPSGTTVIVRIDWSFWDREPQKIFVEDTWGRRELIRFGTMAELCANPEGWFNDLTNKLATIKTVCHSTTLITVEFALPVPPAPPPPEVPPPVVPAPPKPTPEQVEKAREWIITIMLDPRTIIILVIAILGFIFLVRKRE